MPNTLARGGDIGFATEEDLKQNGFPPELITRFFAMQAGDTTEPIRFNSGKWYVFKLAEKRLQSENLTLESPGVRQQITQALINQRKEILNAALLEVAMNDAKIVNNLAGTCLPIPAILACARHHRELWRRLLRVRLPPRRQRLRRRQPAASPASSPKL